MFRKLPPEVLQLIGQITIAMSDLEAIGEQILWILMGLKEDEGRLITTHIGGRTRAEITESLSHHKLNDEENSCLRYFFKILSINTTNRNQIVHAASIIYHDEKILMERYTSKGKGKRFFQSFSIKDLERAFSDIEETANFGQSLLCHINPDPSLWPVGGWPLPDKPPLPTPLNWHDHETPRLPPLPRPPS